MPRWLYFLLIFALAAPVLDLLHVPPLLLFVVAGLGIIPLAALIGESVEDIAKHTGEGIGGLLFATFGNATELIISILALTQGLVDVVRAAIIGSILGNALLVLGVAVCVGGFRHGRLRFETRPASQYASLLALCIAGLLLPSIAEILASRANQTQIVERGVLLSDFIAVALLLGYLASILFSVFHVGDKKPVETTTEGEKEAEELELTVGARSAAAISRLLAYRRQLMQSSVPNKSGVLRQIDGTVDAILSHEGGSPGMLPQQGPQQGNMKDTVQTGADGATTGEVHPLAEIRSQQASPVPSTPKAEAQQQNEPAPPLWRSLLLLAVAAIGVAILSEILVGAIEPVTEALHWNPAFVGLVFLPLIGGMPEYFNTISMALDKRMGMVLAASAGSSIQIALLMAPILVLMSLFMPKRLDLVFSIVEIAVLGIATFLFSEITRDGELVWLEGLLLILLYVMMGGTVFLFGA
jgi:Ca2+:H+ antiporter